MDRIDELEARIDLKIYSLGPWVSISLNVPASEFDGIAESIASATADHANSEEASALADRLSHQFAGWIAQLEEAAQDASPLPGPGLLMVMPGKIETEALVALGKARNADPEAIGNEALRRGIAVLREESR